MYKYTQLRIGTFQLYRCLGRYKIIIKLMQEGAIPINLDRLLTWGKGNEDISGVG